MKTILRMSKARIALLHDILMAALSFPLALYLRMGADTWNIANSYLWEGMIAFTVICLPVFLMSRMYKGIWRYASISDLVAITKAVTLALLIFIPLLFFYSRLELVPRSLPIINWFVLVTLLGAPRFLYRILKDRHLQNVLDRSLHRRIPVLLVGAGDEAELFIREQQRDRDSQFSFVGIVSEHAKRVGREIHGIPVLGSLDEVPKLLGKGRFDPKPQKMIVTKDKIDGASIRLLLETAEAHGMTLSRLPKLAELKHSLEDDKPTIRPIAVEDLLGRPQASLDRPAMKALVNNRRVLVTGAGGTIGSELVRQICDQGPAEIVLLDASEYQLYLIDQEVGRNHPDLSRRAVLGDVRDRIRILDIFRRLKPELVFHAAALKHVPMVEANPMEGVLTNAIGSRIVADACRAVGVSCMVQISTDKVVNPTNVMGSTKRIAESYIQSLDQVSRAEGGTRFVVVRFGNVLGSTGSVVPLFRRQLEAGGPLTVTHPDITRFFMTVREAVELVLQASVIGVNDDQVAGRIFVLDMGEPVKILDLARQMIHLAGLKPDVDVAIEFTGLRPGEKLYEELLHDQEEQLPTVASGILLAAPRAQELDEISAALDEMEDTARSRHRPETLELIRQLVPEYQPDERTLAEAGEDEIIRETA